MLTSKFLQRTRLESKLRSHQILEKRCPEATGRSLLGFFASITDQKLQLIVIASIHQPSSATFDLFNNLLLLSAGLTCYNGPLPSIKSYFERRGLPMPLYTNPAEFLLDLTSSDFSHDEAGAQRQLEKLHSAWRESSEAHAISAAVAGPSTEKDVLIENKSRAPFANVTLALLHRSFIKSHRDVVAYGIRFAVCFSPPHDTFVQANREPRTIASGLPCSP